MRRSFSPGGLFLALALCVAGVSSAAAQALKPEAARDGVIDPAVGNITLADFEVEQADGKSVATYRYAHDGARYTRIVIDELKLSEGDELVIAGVNLSSSGEPNGVTLKGPLLQDEPLVTGLIYGSIVDLRLTSSNLQAARLLVKGFVHQQLPDDPLLSIFDNDERLNFTLVTDAQLQAIGRSVIFLAYMDGETPRVCSGFLINPSMVMTNDHCVNTAAKCSTATVVFDYLNTNEVITMGQQRRCVAVKDALEALDFAVMELDQPVAETAPLALAEADPAPGIPTFLVQHPGGEHKQLSEAGCQPIDMGVPGLDPAQPTDFTHRCDTIGGSSGSPVLRIAGEGDAKTFCVTGLHHLGFQDGTVFETKNRAVKISLIAQRLKANAIPFTSCEN